MKKLAFLSLLFWFWLRCSACNSSLNNDPPLLIYAATSLTTVVPQLTLAFQKQHPHTKIEFSFAASSILAKQIEHGAAADLYFSAHSQWVDYLDKKNQIRYNSRLDLLSNKLVLIEPHNKAGKVTTLHDLDEPSVQKIALGDWTHVPAGIYAKRALEKFGIWDKIVSKCIPALNARAALSYVERGEVTCGIVYRTDAAISEKVRIIDELPEEIQPNICYPVAITKSSKHPLVTTFLSFLKSEEARQIFKENGFETIESNEIE